MGKRPVDVCPHCGGEPEEWQDEEPWGPGGPIPTDWVIQCCSEVRMDTKRACRRLWNKRFGKESKQDSPK